MALNKLIDKMRVKQGMLPPCAAVPVIPTVVVPEPAAVEAADLKPKLRERAMRKCCPTKKGEAVHAPTCPHMQPRKPRPIKAALTERLPDGAVFNVIYDAQKKQWEGSLIIGTMSWSSFSGGVFRLLRELDGLYRDHMRQNPTATPPATSRKSKKKKTAPPADQPAPSHVGEWGHLKEEPCRLCRIRGHVFFLIDEGPEGIAGQQVMRCDFCKRTWQADSSNA